LESIQRPAGIVGNILLELSMSMRLSLRWAQC